MPLEIVAGWFASSVLAPDTFTRTVNAVLSRTAEFRTLQKAVARESGVRPDKAYKRWFSEDGVWDDLIDNYETRYDVLVERMEAHLLDTFTFRRRARGMSTKAQAVALVDATLLTLIESLSAPRSIAIVNKRLNIGVQMVRSDIRDLTQLLSTKKNLGALLRRLPPGARSIVEDLYLRQSAIASNLVSIFTSTQDPLSTTREISKNPPDWVEEAGFEIWHFLAEMAHSFADYGLAAKLFEKVSNLGYERSYCLSRAALDTHADGNPEEAERLISLAREIGEGSPVVGVVSCALHEDGNGVLAAAREVGQLGVDIDVLIAQSLLMIEGPKAANSAYRKIVNTYPQNAGPYLQVIRTAMLASQKSHASFGASERRYLRELAITARDLRREWGGDSAEAVTFSCELALGRDDWNDVLTLGLREPEGQATKGEAENPLVARMVVEAALADGNKELARKLTMAISDDFERAFLSTKYSAMFDDPSPDVLAPRYMEAWILARDESDKFAVWSGLAAIGADLPEREVLEHADDVSSTIILARHDLAKENHSSALTRLLVWRNKSPLVIDLLVATYLQLGDIDSVVETLESAATKFDEPRFRARAASILANNGNFSKAEEIAVVALASVGDDPKLREMLHEVLISSSQSRKAWQEMETRTRGLIDEQGPTGGRRWYLVGALFNQRLFQEAWEVIDEEPKLEADSPNRALVWIDLATMFRSDEKLARQILRHLDDYQDSVEGFAGQIIGKLVLWAQSADLSSEMAEILRGRVAAFLQQNPQDSSFFTIELPEDSEPEEIRDRLRQYLEPGTADYGEFCKQIAASRLPHGMLSALLGKPYASALIHRPANCIPIQLPDATRIAEEDAIALEAIDSTVVVDTSALAVGYFIKDQQGQLFSSFRQAIMPVETRSDIIQSVRSFLMPSDGTIGWDSVGDSPRFTDKIDQTQSRLRAHSQWMLAATEELDIVDWTTIERISQSGDWNSSERMLPWILPLDYALTHGRPLYADDVALRMVAREFGVRSFGTASLLNALVQAGRMGQKQIGSCYDKLRREYCVDLPFEPLALRRILEQDDWTSPGAAFSFSRPAVWQNQIALPAWLNLVRQVSANHPDDVKYWLYWAIIGICHGRNGAMAIQLSAHLLAATLIAKGMRAEALAELLPVARSATADLNLGDILPVLTRTMRDGISKDLTPLDTIRVILALTVELEEADRTTVRKILLS